LGKDLAHGGLDSSACEQYFTALFEGQFVMAILRGMNPMTTVTLCEQAWRAGISVAEVTIESAAAQPSLRAAVECGGRLGRPVGAGTVTSRSRVEAALAAGAGFTVAPGFDEQIARASLKVGLPHLPGVTTPTEIQHAVRRGFRWLKLFPARDLGPAWIKAMLGPFPDVRIVATGGIGAGDAAEFLAAGARVVAVGGNLRQPGALEALAHVRPPPEANADRAEEPAGRAVAHPGAADIMRRANEDHAD
jgi:2-dehydro-3-deoxyphosphogluconate aldolase / (4S)-4-hydroxy-2-oxoglutarate aldolase